VFIDVEYECEGDVEGEGKMKVYLLKLKVNLVLKVSVKMNLLNIRSMLRTMVKQVMIMPKMKVILRRIGIGTVLPQHIQLRRLILTLSEQR